jgi:hypothetical protein
MNKEEKMAFLRKGGILVRSGFNSKGQPCMKWRTIKKDWYNTGLCESIEHADRLNASLVSRHPEKFQID